MEKKALEHTGNYFKNLNDEKYCISIENSVWRMIKYSYNNKGRQEKFEGTSEEIAEKKKNKALSLIEIVNVKDADLLEMYKELGLPN